MILVRKVQASFQKAIQRVGWFGLARVFFYPVTTLLTTPVRLIQALWSCRVLADGRWGDYPGLSPHTAINGLFYWTVASNFYRYGRSGRSPHLGAGDYRLSQLFHYSLPSLYAYWLAGVPTVLIGMGCWWLSHLVWLNGADKLVLSGALVLALVSPLFYGNLVRQNYNAIGWAFFPVGLYGLMSGQWCIAGAAWFAASFGSFTVIFLAGVFSAVFAVFHWNIYPLVALLPAALKLATHFLPSIYQGGFSWAIQGIARGIGLIEVKAKYKRAASKRVKLPQVYLLLTYLQFLFAAYILGGNEALLFLIAILIYLLNSTLFRFADDQSMFMLMFSVATALTIKISEPTLLAFYWIMVAAAPRFLAFPSYADVYDVVPRISPFNIRPFLDGMENFLSPVAKGQRILMAFNDPQGTYEKLFDGYRLLLEPISYASTLKGAHFMPDWWGVFELNYEGAPDFWGRDVPSALKNIKQWKVDYLAVYQESGTELESKWQEAGFHSVGKFAWSDYTKEFRNAYKGPLPDWWLLEVPKFELDQNAGA